MNNTRERCAPIGTVPREILVALSGVALVLFILAHLAGNFFIFGGPDVYNAYAKRLHSLGILLWSARLGLAAVFVIHVVLTIWLALENRTARGARYAVRTRAGGTNVAKLTMVYTGLLLFAFVFLHIADFAFGDAAGPRSVMLGAKMAGSLGLYGLVWNSFANPVHSFLYIVALCALGLHFGNAVSTIWVTLGVLTDSTTAKVNLAAQAMGALVAFAFCSIPLYVLAVTYLMPGAH
jgi:succinate dehydrogenase / fumarate reductase, cytochrome b subunit